ncbi:hypothetical protein [Halopseudomonas salegens]|uniref:Uncharacterized protein n=1 Tax=Halopseudomonas salegens TaxID=1434072 RepID=A0A1H2HW20_9GAMM|nr:hypothetical protein [Halopseudomonas salegens]SDU35915.1 hypothetical protein SAMN05216210_3347 [Halopseudomonas salegens]
MMKKSLSQAVALAASLGMAASAHAVNVNPDGLGQVLLYPVYTVDNENYTSISVTNTTDEFKAVKVRFLEGEMSREVLDFNLYLSPEDVWNGAVVRTAEGARLITNDTSCTAPSIPRGPAPGGVEFRGNEWIPSAQPVPTGDRGRIGYVEVIEMGELDPTHVLEPGVTVEDAIEHALTAEGTFEPGNCEAVVNAWRPGGSWIADNNDGVSPPEGGLYGIGTIVNVLNATMIGYDSIALDNFWLSRVEIEAGDVGSPQHTAPGDLFPNIGQGTEIATFPDGSTLGMDSTFTIGDELTPQPGINAVSAVLAKTAIMNDYSIEAGVRAKTEFVVNFPTKRQYDDGNIAPFVNSLENVPENCVTFGANWWDREEQSPSTPVGDIDFSPRPDPTSPDVPQLCDELNIIQLTNSDQVGGSAILARSDRTGVRSTLNLGENWDAGWLRMNFDDVGRTLLGTDEGGTEFLVRGLPIIGFAATSIANDDADGMLARYAASWVHKAETAIEAN